MISQMLMPIMLVAAMLTGNAQAEEPDKPQTRLQAVDSIIPFEAKYKVQSSIALMPSVSLTHRVAIEGNGFFRASMSAKLPFIEWAEHSLFQAKHSTLIPSQFHNRYKIFTSKKRRSLTGNDFSEAIPDRQTALILLAQRADASEIDAKGTLHTIDDRGRDRSLGYHIMRKQILNDQPVAVIKVWLVHKAEEHAELIVALDVPGLIIQAQIFDENGNREGALQVQHWKRL